MKDNEKQIEEIAYLTGKCGALEQDKENLERTLEECNEEIEKLKAENERFINNMKSVLEIEKENIRKEALKEVYAFAVDYSNGSEEWNLFLHNFEEKFGIEVEE